MPHHHTDMPQPTESRRRLLAADPFPPLAPPSLDGAATHTGDFDVPGSWSDDEDLRREIARLETGPGVDPFAPAARPYTGNDAPGGTAVLPRGYSAPNALNWAANGHAGSGELERLRAENERLRNALQYLATYDYRGPEPWWRKVARDALEAAS